LRFHFLVLILLFSYSQKGQSQNFLPKFRHFGIEDGLSTSATTAICQDKEGKIWIGTHDGLNCFYGTEFKVFYQEPSGLPQSAISDLICDQSGILWIMTYGGGLCRMNPETQEFLPLPKTVNNNWIHGNCLAEDPEGRIWMGYYEGLRIYDPSNDKLTEIEKDKEQNQTLPVTQIAFDQTGNGWLATPFLGLYVVKRSENFPILSHLPFLNFDAEHKGIGFFNKIYGQENGILACTQSGIQKIDLNKNQIRSTPVEMPTVLEEPKALLFDNQDLKWIGLANGQILVRDKNGTISNTSFPYRGRYRAGGVSFIFQDKMGGIWIGGEEGLDFTHPQLSKFTSYAIGPELKFDAFKIIWGIYTEDDRNFLLGSQMGLFSFDAQTFNATKIPIEGQNGNINAYSFLKTTDGEIWAGTQKGIVQLKGKMGNTHAKQIFPEIKGVIGSLIQLPNGEIFAGSYDEQGLYRIRQSDGKFQISSIIHQEGNEQTLCNNSINCLVKGLNDKLWIGTDNGFSEFDLSKNLISNEIWNSRPKDQNISPLIYGLVDLPTELWLGTFGSGIFIVNKRSRKWTKIGKEDGLLNESIYALAQKGNFIWASSNQGLFRIELKNRKVVVFTQGDGLQSNEYNHFSLFENKKSGKIYFGGIQGFDEISFALKPENKADPKVVLTAARIMESGKSTRLSLARIPWILEPTHRDMELEFAALNYLMPEKNQYAYAFEGKDNKRIFLGTKNKLTLINLENGDYTLLVFAANNQGVWSKTPLRISFSIKPYFWETTWFRLLLGAICIMLAIWISRLYLKTKLRKQILTWERQKAVRIERNRISLEMHDDLGSGLTSIKMLSDLLKLKMGDQSSPEVTKIANRSEQLVDSLNTIVWALNDRNDPVKAVVGYMRHYASEQFEGLPIDAKIESRVDPSVETYNISGEVRRDIFLILKEAINNLIKHSGATKAWIQIEAKVESFELHILDNGSQKKKQPQAGGNGLTSMKERAHACKGELSVSTEDGFLVQFHTKFYYERVIE
jgi:ligand-binding sensor domain-containing protein/signal transduction histidine kinase